MITEQAIQNGLDGVNELRSIAESLSRSIEAAKDLASVVVLADALDQVRSYLYEGQSLVARAQNELSERKTTNELEGGKNDNEQNEPNEQANRAGPLGTGAGGNRPEQKE
jgi:hypothetical protein